MVNDINHRWEILHRWGPLAFMVGGGVLLGILAIVAIVFTMGLDPPERVVGVVLLVFFSSLLAIFVGLLGLYPRLHPQSPRLALWGIAATVLAAGAMVTVAVGHSLGPVVAGVIGLEFTTTVMHLERFVFHVFYLGFPLAFLCYGIASWQTQIVPRGVGILMVATAVPLFANFVYEFSLWVFGLDLDAPWMTLVGYGLIPLTSLFVGYLLRTGTEPTGSLDADLEPGS